MVNSKKLRVLLGQGPISLRGPCFCHTCKVLAFCFIDILSDNNFWLLQCFLFCGLLLE